jgi:hypothetical protein
MILQILNCNVIKKRKYIEDVVWYLQVFIIAITKLWNYSSKSQQQT